MTEASYVTVWKAYFLSLVGNWLLEVYKSDLTKEMRSLDLLLVDVGLRSKDHSAETIFSKLVNTFSHWIKPKSASVKLSITDSGIPVVVPTVEFGNREPAEGPPDFISHEAALAVLEKALDEGEVTAWVVLDRLEEAFQGFPNVEVPALCALLRTYLDLLAYPHIRPKLFVRNDLFRKVIQGGFVNLTHVNARKVEILWEEEDLLNLFCRRIRDSADFMRDTNLTGLADKEIFDRISPAQVDQGARKPTTWGWMMSRIRDGNGVSAPRNLIDLIAKAKEAQMRSEDRNPRAYGPGRPIIEPESIRRALRGLSDQRVQDTLLAEAADLAPVIERFRDGKAEHNSSSLATLLQVPEDSVRNTIKPLLEMGFLEETGSSYKVPMLYRDGLAITQGKAFSGEIEVDEEL